MKRQTNIDPATLRELIQALNVQENYINNPAFFNRTILTGHDKDVQKAYVEGLWRMLEAIITDNYTNDDKHIFLDNDGWHLSGVQL